MTLKHKPIYAGKCVVVAEHISPQAAGQHWRFGSVGVRIMSPSAGGEENAFVPASDVYLGLTPADAQALSAYFAALAREIQGVPA